MKKYIIILCIFILSALLFCSCGKKENDPGQTSEADISALTDPSSEEPTEPVGTEQATEADPGEYTLPEVTEKPEEKTEPIVTEKPEKKTEPIVTEKPEKKTEPVVTEKPEEPTESLELGEPDPEETAHSPIELPEVKF